MTPEQEDHRRRLLAQIDEAGEERASDPTVIEVEAALDSFDEDVAALVAQFPAEEADQVTAGLYRDADGVLRTRHRQLRGL